MSQEIQISSYLVKTGPGHAKSHNIRTTTLRVSKFINDITM